MIKAKYGIQTKLGMVSGFDEEFMAVTIAAPNTRCLMFDTVVEANKWKADHADKGFGLKSEQSFVVVANTDERRAQHSVLVQKAKAEWISNGCKGRWEDYMPNEG